MVGLLGALLSALPTFTQDASSRKPSVLSPPHPPCFSSLHLRLFPLLPSVTSEAWAPQGQALCSLLPPVPGAVHGRWRCRPWLLPALTSSIPG